MALLEVGFEVSFPVTSFSPDLAVLSQEDHSCCSMPACLPLCTAMMVADSPSGIIRLQ